MEYKMALQPSVGLTTLALPLHLTWTGMQLNAG